MDATVLDMKRCADLFLFSTTFFQAITYSHQTTRKLSLSVQRSADGSSNSLKSTQPHTINQAPEQPPYPSRPEKPAREACAACRRGFVGGWLLGCRESAKSVFQKSELASLKQRTFEKQRRFPPAKNQLPSCRASDRPHTPPGLIFQSGR